MTLPIHTVKHVKSSFRKIQVITICLTVLTLAAALLAAISGIRLVNLEKQQSAEIVQTAPPPAVVDDALNKQIEDLKTDLAKEKDASKKLKSRIAELKMQIASLKKAKPAPRQPVPTSESSTEAAETPSPTKPFVEKTPPPPEKTPQAEQKPDTSLSTTESNIEPAQSTEPPAPAQVPGKANAQSGGQVPPPASPGSEGH